MAESGPKWPGPVTFNDDDPKKGFCTIFLTITNMKVKKGFMSDAKPENAVIKPDYSAAVVCILVDVTEKDGSTTSYQYKKNMPEDIDPDKCKFKVKNNQVIISLAKAEQQSWAPHAKYLIKKEIP